MARRAGLFAVVLLAACVVPAAAQGVISPAPDRGTNAFAAAFGAAVGGEEDFSAGPTLVLAGERYLRPRLAIRGQLALAWFGLPDVDPDASASPIALTGSLVHHWDARGRWHPFVSVGFGVYKYRFTEADLDSSDTQAGLHLGGGVEIALGPRAALTGELSIHPVAGSADSLLDEYSPWFTTVTVGYKRFF